MQSYCMGGMYALHVHVSVLIRRWRSIACVNNVRGGESLRNNCTKKLTQQNDLLWVSYTVCHTIYRNYMCDDLISK